MDKTDLTDVEVKPHQGQDEESGYAPTHEYGRGELEVIEIRNRNSILRKLKAAEEWLDEKIGVETTGADRIPEDQRQPPSILYVSLLFQSYVSRQRLTAWHQRCCSYGFPC
jgi:hypothetical protein